MALKNLLVTGATGKQGGALIEALLASKPPVFTIYALTRDASSASAKRLAAKNVNVIEGDTTLPGPIFSKLPNPYGVFSVTVPGKNEEGKAIPLIDAALANGVKHFIFTSADRGGPAKSDADPTPVPHFITKFNIEKHLKEASAKSDGRMRYTILRPVAFMDNLTPDFIGRSFATMVKQLGNTRLAMVCTADIGRVAARALQNPEKYSGKAITLAGDSLDFAGLSRVFEEETGQPLQTTFEFFVNGLQWAIHDLGMMFKWFRAGGYGYDIDAATKDELELQDFRSWLKTYSKFEMK